MIKGSGYQLLTRTELIMYLSQHAESFPDKGDYHVELRDRSLVSTPKGLKHDDDTKTVILTSFPTR